MNAQRNAQGDFIWYELMTSDLKGASAFYKAVAGMEIGDASDQPGQDYRMIRYGDDFVGGALALTKDMTDNGAAPLWIGYIGVTDVDATAEVIKAKGGHVFMTRDIPQGRLAMCADPQGAPFYIMRGSSDGASTVWQDNVVGHFGWNELWTPDQKSALDFYGSLFGWTQQGTMPMGPRGDYLFMMQGDKRLGAFGPASDAAKPAYWRHVFRVPSIGTSVEAAKSLGATEIDGPHQVPGGDYVMYGKDPQGATFVLVGGA
ncbi:MAG: VOC family protein [Sphingobium sp.]|nr:VOC family protein [Sphingobium sp.]